VVTLSCSLIVTSCHLLGALSRVSLLVLHVSGLHGLSHASLASSAVRPAPLRVPRFRAGCPFPAGSGRPGGRPDGRAAVL